MFGSAVHEQRFQQHEKMARRMGRANIGLPALMGLLALAKLRAQFFEYGPGATQLGTADLQPLELGQKIAACQRRQPLQIILNPVGLYHGAQLSAIARRAQALSRIRGARI